MSDQCKHFSDLAITAFVNDDLEAGEVLLGFEVADFSGGGFFAFEEDAGFELANFFFGDLAFGFEKVFFFTFEFGVG